jgi:L,D-transpeptidase catalytic domain
MILIDKSAQKMTVTVNGEDRYVWPVSTGRSGYDTPSGDFQPFRMEKDHFSREWDDAPMPNSIFFSKIGHAIHGTFEARNLGRPASHGRVRLSTQNAATLFALVKQEGVFNTRVRLVGQIPNTDPADDAIARRDNRDNYARIYSDDDTSPQRSRQRGWYDDGRSYYYRPQPYYEQRRYYGGRGFFPFGW